jgi:hypothetical protein
MNGSCANFVFQISFVINSLFSSLINFTLDSEGSFNCIGVLSIVGVELGDLPDFDSVFRGNDREVLQLNISLELALQKIIKSFFCRSFIQRIQPFRDRKERHKAELIKLWGGTQNEIVFNLEIFTEIQVLNIHLVGPENLAILIADFKVLNSNTIKVLEL